jgi:two-component system, LuxR family, sensor kinase FixL
MARQNSGIRSKDEPAANRDVVHAHCNGLRSVTVSHMEDRLDQTERALREREVTFAALAKVAPVGIMRFDAEGRCNYVNDRWSAITGGTIDSAIGDGWQRAIHPDDLATVIDRWTRMRLQEEVFREEYRICRPDRSVRWVLAEGVPLRSYSGRLLGFIRAVTDITRHRELQSQVNAARVLETRENEQRRFSQDLHDGLGQHLIGLAFRVSALQADLDQAHSPLARDAAEILSLINDASEQARGLARGIHPVPLRPDGLLVALQELVEKLCHTAKMNCLFECEEPVLVHDNAIATHVYRIAQEAITNAMKHSGAATITVSLRNLGDSAELIVQDDGAGFTPNELSQSGRGLNIMRNRARLIAAILDLTSAPGGGTIMRCEFFHRRVAS